MADLKIFTENIEHEALNQIYTLVKQPAFSDCKIRIMPDVHAGAGCVIGFTADLGEKVIPNIVGVDIGCGMLTTNLGNIDIDFERLDNIIREYDIVSSAKSESEAQKYAEQAKEISESLSGALRPLGTINFADLPNTANATSGDMYNIVDQFTTTTDFKEGAGNIIPSGSNVYLTIDRYWDVLAGTPVTGVKGAKEAYYRRGNVNITPTNIGAVAEDGNISDTTVTFADATTRVNLVSGEKVSVGFRKIKKWFADLKSFAFKDLANNLTTTTTGSALDASQGKILNDKYGELNQSLGNLKTDFKINLDGIKIKTGTIVKEVKSGNNSFVLFTLEQVKNMFGLENFSVNDIAILISNGDGKAFPSHLEGVSMLNNNWYVVFKDIVQGNMSCRVQYVIFYWGN